MELLSADMLPIRPGTIAGQQLVAPPALEADGSGLCSCHQIAQGAAEVQATLTIADRQGHSGRHLVRAPAELDVEAEQPSFEFSRQAAGLKQQKTPDAHLARQP